MTTDEVKNGILNDYPGLEGADTIADYLTSDAIAGSDGELS